MVTYKKLLEKTPKQLMRSLQRWKWKKQDIINLLEGYEVIELKDYPSPHYVVTINKHDEYEDTVVLIGKKAFENQTFCELCELLHDDIIDCLCEEYEAAY